MSSGPPPALPLWRRIEEIRLREGWTRTQVATMAGVARTTLDSWRRQPRPPLAPTVHDVADRLGIDRAEALRLAGINYEAMEVRESAARTAAAIAESNEIIDQITAKLYRASARQRREALALLDELIPDESNGPDRATGT